MRYLPIFLTLIFVSCGPGIRTFGDQTAPTPGIYALLPVKHGPTLREYDAAYLTRILQNSLESLGVSLIDPVLIQETCIKLDCRERTVWSTIPQLQGLITVDITSNWDSNIIAAHYSTISGELRLSDMNNQKILEIQHRESDRGGLLFDSGQVVRGLSSQAEFSDSEAFRMLAKKFARNLALALKPHLGRKDSTHRDFPTPVITSSVVSPGEIKLCISVPAPDMRAYLLFGSMRTPLSPQSKTENGTTSCRNFSADALRQKPVPAIEVRDLRGNSRRTFLNSEKHLNGWLSSCRTTTHAQWKDVKNSSDITFYCSVQDKDSVSAKCAQKDPCHAFRWKVYGAKTKSGPYVLLGETNEPQFRMPQRAADNLHFFYYTYQEANGSLSTPQIVSEFTSEQELSTPRQPKESIQ